MLRFGNQAQKLEIGWQVCIARVRSGSAGGDDLTGSCGAHNGSAVDVTVTATQRSNHGCDWGHSLIGQLATAAQSVVLGLDLLLGVGGLFVGLVLDEEDLRLAGGAGLLHYLGVQVAFALLAQHVDDGLLLVGGGADLDGLPVVALRRLDEHHVVVALGHADGDVTFLVILSLLRGGVDEEALGDDGLLLLHLLLLVVVSLCGRLLVDGLRLHGGDLDGALEEGASTGGGADAAEAGRARVIVVALGCG